MKFLDCLAGFYSKLQSPLSSTEEIVKDLGFELPSNLMCKNFIDIMAHSGLKSTKLVKFMLRNDAEKIFASAIRKERFSKHSLYSYYLDKGWVGFYLLFDQDSKLRRIYFQHKDFKKQSGIEIGLLEKSLRHTV